MRVPFRMRYLLFLMSLAREASIAVQGFDCPPLRRVLVQEG